MSDTESREPTWTLHFNALQGHGQWRVVGKGPDGKHGERVVVARPEDIRREVCQELASALREENARSNGMFDPDDHVAEFVERFGADRGGEDG